VRSLFTRAAILEPENEIAYYSSGFTVSVVWLGDPHCQKLLHLNHQSSSMVALAIAHWDAITPLPNKLSTGAQSRFQLQGSHFLVARKQALAPLRFRQPSKFSLPQIPTIFVEVSELDFIH